MKIASSRFGESGQANVFRWRLAGSPDGVVMEFRVGFFEKEDCAKVIWKAGFQWARSHPETDDAWKKAPGQRE